MFIKNFTFIDSEQPVLEWDIPVGGLELDWSERSLPTQTILWFIAYRHSSSYSSWTSGQRHFKVTKHFFEEFPLPSAKTKKDWLHSFRVV